MADVPADATTTSLSLNPRVPPGRLAADKCHQRAPGDRLLWQVDRHDVIRPRGAGKAGVAEVIKRACAKVGVDPDTARARACALGW
jgi:hypothetical protein